MLQLSIEMRRSTVEVNKQSVTSLLGNVLGTYKFTLPRVQLQRGVVYVGGATRLRALVSAMLSPRPPKPFKIGVIGGR